MIEILLFVLVLIALGVVSFQLVNLTSQIDKLREDLTTVFKGTLEKTDKVIIKANDVSDLLDIVIENTKKKPSTKKIVKECKSC